MKFHWNLIKPLLIKAIKIIRLELYTPVLYILNLFTFTNIVELVHIDEKWFNIITYLQKQVVYNQNLVHDSRRPSLSWLTPKGTVQRNN